MKEFIIKDYPHFRLKIRIWNCLKPDSLRTIEFIQECIKDGEADFSSTYQFFMTNEEIKLLSQGFDNASNYENA